MGVFLGVLIVASPLPLAAGIMLTFPVINGLVLINDDPHQTIATASTMLLLPVINASLCAVFIFAYWLLATSDNYYLCAVALTVVIFVFWLTLFGFRKHFRIPAEKHLSFAISCAIACIILAIVFSLVIRYTMPGDTLLKSTATFPGLETLKEFLPSIPGLLFEKRWRIFLFAIAILIVAIWIECFSPKAALKGFLGGLPIVPFGALCVMGTDPATVENPALLRSFASGIWLAPVVPVFFVWRLSRYFSATTAGMAIRVAALIGAWLACLVAILLLSAAMLKFL